MLRARRLTGKVETLSTASATQSSQASQQQAVLSADGKRLRQNLAGLKAELEKEKAAHGADVARYTEVITQLQQANAKLRDELSSTSGELEQTRVELTGKLDRVQSEKEATRTELKTQLGQVRQHPPPHIPPSPQPFLMQTS